MRAMRSIGWSGEIDSGGGGYVPSWADALPLAAPNQQANNIQAARECIHRNRLLAIESLAARTPRGEEPNRALPRPFLGMDAEARVYSGGLNLLQDRRSERGGTPRPAFPSLDTLDEDAV